MKRILFVDDEPAVLSGLQRMLRPMRDHWEMTFTGGGEAALELLAREDFEVVISDMRMPGMDGVQLLGEVQRRHPRIVRIILSGHADHEMILRAVGPTHQFLNKPCSPELLCATVERACALQDRVVAPGLKELAASLDSLPSPPVIYNQIVAEIGSPAGSLEKVGEIIASDVAMTAKVLQIVNSAFFGMRQRVSDPGLAVRFLGLETIKALVLSVHIFSKYDCDPRCEQAVRELWSASARVGARARQIALLEKSAREIVDQAFFGGMLHHVGQLLLLAHAAERYSGVLQRLQASPELDIEAVEFEVFGGTHSDLGAYLLGIWGLPGSIIESVAFHHHPAPLAQAGFGPLTCVHAAAAITAGLEGGSSGRQCTVDLSYLEALGLVDRYPLWLEECRDQGEVAAA
ncbi:MAG: HDOD domain-containing protein [Planctomycetes bacterium]|nr:HDOD domain-containing protein [Planctomycetota bacterium]